MREVKCDVARRHENESMLENSHAGVCGDVSGRSKVAGLERNQRELFWKHREEVDDPKKKEIAGERKA